MNTETSQNPERVGAFFELFAPRNLGRGACWDSAKAVKTVSWNGSNVLNNGIAIFALAGEPEFLDMAYDQLDRPQVAFSNNVGESFIYFYNGLISDYELLSIGFNAFEPAICNDYFLGGVTTIVAYLKSGIPTYRLQADRFSVEYRLVNRKARGIKAFGYGKETNSVQIIVGLWR